MNRIQRFLKVYYDSKRRYGTLKMANQQGGKRIQLKMAVLGIKSIVAKKCKPLKAGKKYGTEREYYEQ